MTALTDSQFERYARHLILDEIGEAGQAALLRARVLVVGAGGLGAPVALYLAAAGVGTLGIVDDDIVDLSNLQRQIIHATARIGQPKTDSAAASLAMVNPEVTLIRHRQRLAPDNALDLVSAYDVIADGSDNVATRYLLNDVCRLARKPLVAGAVLRFTGQLFRFEPGAPCYRCTFPEPPALIPRCASAGILGAVCGVIGSLQATEILKALLGLGDSLAGRMVLYDALGPAFRVPRLKTDPACRLAGARDLADLGWPMTGA